MPDGNITLTTPMLGPDAKPLDPETSEADARILEWQTSSPYYVPPADADKHKHIVDILIRERATNLSQSKLWPLYRATLNELLDYRRAVKMVNTAGRMNAAEAFAYASDMLKMKLQVEGLEHIPKEGPFIIALNHPTGIADGLAVHDALAGLRDDVIVFVNADAIRLNPLITDKLIPVEWRDDKKSRAKSRETLKATNKAFAEERAIVLFPSGRLAYINPEKQMIERPWMSTVASLPKRYKCPIIPANLISRNSWLYYWFNNVNEELRDMTLFHELLNKKNQVFDIKIERPITHDQLLEDNDEAAEELRLYVTQGIREGYSLEEWRAARS
ncbi:MAG: lysophospholipid acyltransferase family protein [Pseudomonadota bacterium]